MLYVVLFIGINPYPSLHFATVLIIKLINYDHTATLYSVTRQHIGIGMGTVTVVPIFYVDVGSRHKFLKSSRFHTGEVSLFFRGRSVLHCILSIVHRRSFVAQTSLCHSPLP